MKEALRRHSLLMLGFALHLALSLILLWDPYATVPIDRSVVEQLKGLDYMIRSFGLPASLILATFLLRRSEGRWRRAIAVCSALSFAAAIAFLLVVLVGGSDGQKGILIAFSAFVALGFGGMFAQFFAFLLRVPQEEFVLVVLCSSAMSGVVTLLMQGAWAYALLLPLCVLLVAVFLVIALSQENAFASEACETCEAPFRSNAPFRMIAADILRPLTCFALCALVAGLMRTQTFGDHGSMAFADAATKVLCPAGAILLAAFSRQLMKESLLERLYDVLFPLTAALYLLLPLLGQRFGAGLLVVDMLVFFLLSPLFIISSRVFANRYGMADYVVCGGFACVYYTAVAIGSALGLRVVASSSYQVVLLLVIALIAIWVLAMTEHLLAWAKKARGGATPADPLAAKLDAVQQEYGLSPREREVAGFIVRGRSSKYIAETLYLSQSTVQTHTKALYKKLDVHSKQELISLVEEHEV